MSLLRLSADLLAHRTTRVLIPDLAWPPYAAVVSKRIEERGGKSIGLRLRSAVFSDRLSQTEITERVVGAFMKSGCDGALLTAVSHDGIRLQLDQVIARLKEISPVSFILVDASQGIGHVPTEFGIHQADFVVAGVHKWLRAGLPLGIGFGTRATITEMGHATHDDPLLSLTSRCRARARAVAETVNVWPLFSCQAAACELRPGGRGLSRSFATQLKNVATVAEMLSQSDWRPLVPHPSLQSGILLARARQKQRNRRANAAWRARFQSSGVQLTSYPGPLLRMSLPGRQLTNSQVAHLYRAFSDAWRDS